MVAPVLKGICSMQSEIYKNRYRRVGSLASYSDDDLASDLRSQVSYLPHKFRSQSDVLI